jgi:hypothetical protein
MEVTFNKISAPKQILMVGSIQRISTRRGSLQGGVKAYKPNKVFLNGYRGGKSIPFRHRTLTMEFVIRFQLEAGAIIDER